MYFQESNNLQTSSTFQEISGEVTRAARERGRENRSQVLSRLTLPMPQEMKNQG